ncbi:MAG: patatin-like phospholipase family protein [Ferruginibacter sp.]
MKILLSILTILLFDLGSSAQNRPKIGLTLSGGGAKGLAHIGILKAIDSAGLKIDYITGTSMGAVLGALYAVGYTGKEIEQLCKQMDWDNLLSNQAPLRVLSMEEKNQYARFALELPYINKKIKLTTGVIQGQELSIKLSDLFFRVSHIRNFNEFPIPFKCMATDLETGNLVVLDTGNIVTAIRASMAIPSVFTAVTVGDRKLVDGGLVRNFPIKNVKEMGADITIGSNVSGGLSTKDKIVNPVDVLMQMAFFREASDFKEELPITNHYIYMPLQKYNMGSFGSSAEIMLAGNEAGRNYYPEFKKLADSVNSLRRQDIKSPGKNSEKRVYITSYQVNGLQKTSSPFFIHLLDFYSNNYYTAAQLGKKVRRAYGSRYYTSVTYSLKFSDSNTARIIFDVEENPSTLLKAGLYYTSFRGININLNVTTRDFIIPNSRMMLSVSLGESIQVEAEHLQYMGRKKNVAVITAFNMDRLIIDSYKDFKRDGSYKQDIYKGYLNLQNSGNNKIAGGIGSGLEYVQLTPSIHSGKETRGNFSSVKTYAYFNFNNLDQSFYPTKGARINSELGLIYNQHYNISVMENGQEVSPDLNFDNFSRLTIDGNFFIPVKHRLTMLAEFQTGINFTNKPNELNNFYIGGINGSFRNQVRFAGLQEATINAATVAVLQVGLRYNLYNNIYVIGRVNGLVKDFATEKNATSNRTALSGYAITFAYKSPIGPLELSGMYSDQSKRIQSYVTFGIPFR